MTGKIKLIMFPFAGGNSNSFKNIEAHFSEKGNVECMCVEYPGHGRRYNESFLSNPHELVNDIIRNFSEWFNGEFFFFGYSMGALIARMVIDELSKTGAVVPNLLFALACRSPREISTKIERCISDLPEDKFIEYLVKLGGIHEEILKQPSALEFFSPIIRADFKIFENICNLNLVPMNVPIYVIGGQDDEISLEDLYKWDMETTSNIKVLIFPGGHFFLYEQHITLVNVINDIIARKSILY